MKTLINDKYYRIKSSEKLNKIRHKTWELSWYIKDKWQHLERVCNWAVYRFKTQEAWSVESLIILKGRNTFAHTKQIFRCRSKSFGFANQQMGATLFVPSSIWKIQFGKSPGKSGANWHAKISVVNVATKKALVHWQDGELSCDHVNIFGLSEITAAQ